MDTADRKIEGGSTKLPNLLGWVIDLSDVPSRAFVHIALPAVEPTQRPHVRSR
jgi:hypothetical protein